MKKQNGVVSEESSQVASISYHQLLLRYADTVDRLLLAAGLLCAVLAAFCIPLMTLLLGHITDAFVRGHDNATSAASPTVSRVASNNTSRSANSHTMGASLLSESVVLFAAGSCTLAVVQFVLSAAFVFCLDWSAARQVSRMRQLYFSSVLRQELAWFETREPGCFVSHLSEGMTKLEAGMDRQLGMFVSQLMVLCVSLVNALVHGWKLTLIVMTAVPVLGLVVFVTVQAHKVFSRRWTDSYSSAAAVAMETFSSISTVMSFGGQEKAIQRYNGHVACGSRWWLLSSVGNGVCGALVWLVIFAAYALCFWYGTQLVLSGHYQPSTLIVVFFSVMIAAVQLGNATPFISAFIEAQHVASAVFAVIDRKSLIDSSSTQGERLSTVRGELEFRDVFFHYPSRPDVPVLRGLSLHVPAGHTVALVGASGCGKSTCLQLLQRLYSADSGQVRLDGHALQSLNVGWLRAQLAVVPQHPVLFPGTILQNIRYGRADSSDEEVRRAAEVAQAWSFIDQLPDKLLTVCGHAAAAEPTGGRQGGQLSGGQRQRVAIARAVLANSELLLLDEATSALDPATETQLLLALKQARVGKTTVVVAHRLSSVAGWADSIAVLCDGRLQAVGSHDQLMATPDGHLYRHMFLAQTQSEAESEAVVSGNGQQRPGGGAGARVARAASGGARPPPTAATATAGAAAAAGGSGGVDHCLPFCDTATQLRRTLSLRSTSRSHSAAAGAAPSKTSGDIEGASGTVAAAAADTTDGDESGAGGAVMRQLWRLSAAEWPQLAAAVLASGVSGCALPLYALFFGDVLANLAQQDVEVSRAQSRYHSLLFLAVGVLMAVAIFTQNYMFGVSGVRLTTRLRRRVFSALVRQEMAFFDAPDHSVGTLCSRLSADTANVHGACGPRLGVAVQGCVTLCVALAVAVYMSWQLALVLVPFVPLVLAAFYAQVALMSGRQGALLQSGDTGGAIVEQAVSNIVSVMSLGIEASLTSQYSACLTRSLSQQRLTAAVRGGVFGLASAVPLLAYAACMGYGGSLVAQGALPFQNVFKAGEALILSTMMVGQTVAYSPSYQMALQSATRLLALLRRRPGIDLSASAGLRMSGLTGDIQFDRVSFRYPARAEQPVLRHLSLSVASGRCVALVGTSGCGKSTVLKLLLRLYDPLSGDVRVDGQNVASLNVPWLRGRMALVPQDCVLFNMSIADNIAYGDNSREVSREEVEQAARQAGLHQFVVALPDGYTTVLGHSSLTQLSGGQRQRLAIARALVGRPQLLLLDEATAALDADSELAVQRALRAAARGRTCLMVTHRLHTVARTADLIAVLGDGAVLELGTHDQLLAAGNHYSTLYRAQTHAIK